MKRNLLVLAAALSLAAAVALTSCAGEQPPPREIELAPVSEMPERVQAGPINVQEAYRFAVANPELVRQFPCYCGCVNVGHESNLDCYVSETRPDGTVLFDSHALG